MSLITKQDLINATKERKLFVIKDFYKDFPSWKSIDEFYDFAKNRKTIEYNWFGGMVAVEDRKRIEHYRKAMLDIFSCHRGHVLYSMMIISFLNRNNNLMTDKHLIDLYLKFAIDNPIKIPKQITVVDDGFSGIKKEDLAPGVHSDPEDRFFIQGNGQTLWKVFHDNKELNYEILLNQGDMAYIPKGVFHSVDAMSPRHSVSIAFGDDPEITSLGMV